MKPYADTTVQLDGRHVGVAEFGDPSGRPWLLSSGIPGSRLSAGWVLGRADLDGIRIIGVDRPGTGASTPVPRRSLSSWGDDVAGVLGALDLDGTGLLAVSGGGPFAAAVAADRPELVSRLVLLSAMVPMASFRGVLADDELRWAYLADLQACSARGAAGAAEDLRLCVRPHGFDDSSIVVPTAARDHPFRCRRHSRAGAARSHLSPSSTVRTDMSG